MEVRKPRHRATGQTNHYILEVNGCKSVWRQLSELVLNRFM